MVKPIPTFMPEPMIMSDLANGSYWFALNCDIGAQSMIYRGLAEASEPSLPAGGANCSKPDIGVVVMKPLLLIVPGVGRGDSIGGIEAGGGIVRGLASNILAAASCFGSGLVSTLAVCLGLCDVLGVGCSIAG